MNRVLRRQSLCAGKSEDRSMFRTFSAIGIAGNHLKCRIQPTIVLAAALLAGPALRQATARQSPLNQRECQDFGSQQFAYVTNAGGNTVSGYRINASSGALTPVPESPFRTGNAGPTTAAVDPAGRFLYVTNQYAEDNNVAGFRINRETGRLTPIPGSPFATGSGPASIAIDPSGKFAYVANLGSNNVSAYRVEPITGRLIALPGSPFAAGTFPSYVTVDPLGKFVYVVNALSNDISGYAIAATGTLTPIAGSPFPAGTYPLSVAVDPNERFVYVANQGSDNISGYTINATTGALTALPTSPYAAGGGGLFSIAFDPAGGYVYAAGYGGIFAYSIDQNTTDFSGGFPPTPRYGQLTQVSGSPFGGGAPNSIVVDYTGKFAYASNKSSNDVSAYTINQGTLTAVSGAPFIAGMGPVFVALVRPSSVPIYSAVQVPYPQNVNIGAVERFTPSAINNKGDVAGSVGYYTTAAETFGSGFLYAAGKTIPVGFDQVSTANGINDSAEVVGQTDSEPPNPLAPPPQAFLFSNGSQIEIDTVQGRRSAAYSINNGGHIAGSLSTGTCATPFSCNLGDTHAFLYAGSGLIDLGTLGGDFSEGRGINNLGEITGGSNRTAGGVNHLFLYTQGSLHDLGTVGGKPTEGIQINDKKEIIGSPSFLYRDGEFRALPIVPSGINNRGDIVGGRAEANGSNHAFLYSDGKVVDLNRLLTDPALTLLTGAAGINDRGQIVASGLNGQIYILTPQK
jgi:probable HAF family extracellular repeat protein